MRRGDSRPLCILQGHSPGFLESDAANKTQVARKTFVDNMCKQVIERHLLRHLPEISSPQCVAGYTNSDLERIASETTNTVMRQKQLRELHANLTASLHELHK